MHLKRGLDPIPERDKVFIKYFSWINIRTAIVFLGGMMVVLFIALVIIIFSFPSIMNGGFGYVNYIYFIFPIIMSSLIVLPIFAYFSKKLMSIMLAIMKWEEMTGQKVLSDRHRNLYQKYYNMSKTGVR